MYVIVVCVIFFFFQAEDGIRDATVTGVQTCALPICSASGRGRVCSQRSGSPPSRRPAAARPRPSPHPSFGGRDGSGHLGRRGRRTGLVRGSVQPKNVDLPNLLQPGQDLPEGTGPLGSIFRAERLRFGGAGSRSDATAKLE